MRQKVAKRFQRTTLTLIMLLSLLAYFAFSAVNAYAFRYTIQHQMYKCNIRYESTSENRFPAAGGAPNIYVVKWYYEGLCNISVKSINKTHIEVLLSAVGGNDTLAAFEVYKEFNYAWLVVFNNTRLPKPVFVGFMPLYSTLAINRSLNRMMLVYQGSKIVVQCGDFILKEPNNSTYYKNVWIVTSDNGLLAIYGMSRYPIYTNFEIRLPDGIHIIRIEVRKVGININALNVCKPEQYIDLKGLGILLIFTSIPIVTIFMLKRRRR